MNIANKNIFISEENIVKYLKEGNEQAFQYIFDKYYDFLCLIAQSYLRDNFIAETIVGDIIYNLWEIRENLDIKTSLRPYLTRSVKNRCINHLQKEYVQREISMNQYEDKIAIEELFFIESKHPLENLLEQELSKKIDQLIEELAPECRQVFIMSRYDNMKYEEIAEKLGISINTVKYHIKNALTQLRTELKDYLIVVFLFLIIF